MIKFKEAGNGQFIRISLDESGKKISNTATFGSDSKSGTMGAGMYEELLKWVDDGGKIEPFETVAEVKNRKAEDAKKAVKAMINECKENLNDSEIHVSNDPPYPDDVEAWKDARAKWRVALRSGKIQAIEPRPF